MELKELKNGDRFTMTVSGTVVKTDAIGGDGVRVLFDGCDRINETNTIFNTANNTVVKHDAPPAVGDQLISATASYVLEAIVGDWWVVSPLDRPALSPRSFPPSAFRAFTRIPMNKAS